MDQDFGGGLAAPRRRRGWRLLGLAALGDLAWGAVVGLALAFALLAAPRPSLGTLAQVAPRLLAPLSLALPAFEAPPRLPLLR